MKKLLSLLVALAAALAALALPASAEKPNSEVAIPVLLYHVVSPSPDPANLYQYSLAEFEKQMAYLKKNGYKTLTIKQYHQIRTGQVPMPKKPILLTFDDNSSDFYPHAYPVLQKYGMKATQFTVSDWIGGSWNMTLSEIQTVMKNGIDIENHTVTHPNLSSLSFQEQYEEISGAASALQQATGQETTFFAYPYGSYNDATIQVLEQLGFQGAFTVAGGLSTDQHAPFELPRIMILNGDTLEDFQRKITTGY